MKHPIFSLVSAACLLTPLCEVLAVEVTLNFASLPSTQGWEYSSSGVAESTAFSVTRASTLFQNTIGIGNGAGANYQLRNALNSDDPVRMAFSARFIAEEAGTPNDYGALSVGVVIGRQAFGIALGINKIKDIANTVISTTIDTSQFHDYLLVATPGQGYSLHVDGQLVATGAPQAQNTSNYAYFGDGSNLNAAGEFGAFRLTQNPILSYRLPFIGGPFNITNAPDCPNHEPVGAVDYAVYDSWPVVASERGIVESIGQPDAASCYGNQVVLKHPDGRRTRYAHLSQANVVQGMDVQRAQTIGYVGKSTGTGPTCPIMTINYHLHFEIRSSTGAHERRMISTLPGTTWVAGANARQLCQPDAGDIDGAATGPQP